MQYFLYMKMKLKGLITGFDAEACWPLNMDPYFHL